MKNLKEYLINEEKREDKKSIYKASTKWLEKNFKIRGYDDEDVDCGRVLTDIISDFKKQGYKIDKSDTRHWIDCAIEDYFYNYPKSDYWYK